MGWVNAIGSSVHSRVAGAWHWLRRHWIEVLLPPAVFLLGAGITHQVLRAWDGVHNLQWKQNYQAAYQAGMQGDRQEALEKMLAAAKAAPDEPRAQFDLAIGFQKLGQEDRALEALERAVRVKPADPQNDESLWVGIVGAYCDLGRFDDAERVLRAKVLSRWPDSAGAHYHAGRIQMRNGDAQNGLRQALASFEKSLALDPSLLKARYHYGVCLARLGRPAEAEQAFRAVIEAHPSHGSSYHELSVVLRQQGKHQEAQQAVAKFQELDTKRARIRYLETQIALQKSSLDDLLELGRLHLDLNHADRAVEILEVYAKQNPTDPRGHRTLAEAYRQLELSQDADLADQLAEALAERQGETE